MRILKLTLLAGLLVAASTPARAQQDLLTQPGQRELEEAEKAAKANRQPRLTKMPKLVYQVAPVYPPQAQEERRQGDVIVRITIDDEGYVSRVEVVQSAGEDLDWATLGAVANFVFEPAEVDDVPAPIALDYKQAFVLQQVIEEKAVEPTLEEEEGLPSAEEMAKAAAAAAVAAGAQGADDAEVEFAPGTDPRQPLNFLGRVREAGTKAPLVDVEVFIQPDDEEKEPFSVITDKEGRFFARGVPLGQALIRITATGYEQSTSLEEFKENEAVKAIYYLPRKSYNKFETVVISRKAQKEVSRIALSRAEVSQVPGTFGDPIRVIENLPGMARAPLLGGALQVRGANPQDTGVYIDGVPIPLLYHFLALTSVVNAEFLETINFYPGGFGARYGRATAGIVDVQTRDLKLRSCRGTAKVDIIDSAFFFGCPVTLWGDEVDTDAPNPRRITFAGAARRSYLDAVLPLAIELLLPPGAGALTAAPVYWDYQFKAEYRPLAEHTFTLFSFGSDDTLKVLTGGTADNYGVQLDTQQTFHRLVASWEWRPTARLTNRVAPWVGLEFNRFGANAGPINAGFQVDIRSWGLRDDLTYTLFDGININAGLDALGGLYEVSGNLPFSNEINGFPRVVPRLTGSGLSFAQEGDSQTWGTYLEAEMGPFRGLKVTTGFRLELFHFQDSFNVSAMPRVAARYEVFPGTTLKGAYGVYEKLSDPQTLSRTLGNPKLFPERSRHHVLGIEQKLTRNINVDFQGFYNRRSNIVVPSDRILSVQGGQAVLENYSNDGRGNSYGLELMLRHELTRSLFGWISYTLMRSEQHPKPGSQITLFSFDQTHILTLVGQYKLPWHMPFREWAKTGRLPRGLWWNTGWAVMSGDWSVGGRFRAVSGNPTTPYTTAAHDLDTDEFVARSGGINTARLPMFMQLDIRVDYKMAFDSFLLNFYADFINVTNRKNAEVLLWDYRYRESQPLALLPFLPVMGLSSEF